ncbi:MAG: hypothetical protein ACP5F9_05470 [Thiomonas sp.]|jgi:hypothetical protein
MSTPPTQPPEHDDPLAPRSEAERLWLARSAEQLRAQRDTLDVSANWSRIAQHLHTSEATASPQQTPRPHRATATGLVALGAWLSRWRQGLAGFAVGATAAAVMAFTLGPALHGSAQTGTALQPLGQSQPASAETARLQIVFRDQASIAEVRAALQAAGASVRDGPSRLGVWQVEVPKAQASAALAQLAKSAVVEHVARQP